MRHQIRETQQGSFLHLTCGRVGRSGWIGTFLLIARARMSSSKVSTQVSLRTRTWPNHRLRSAHRASHARGTKSNTRDRITETLFFFLAKMVACICFQRVASAPRGSARSCAHDPWPGSGKPCVTYRKAHAQHPAHASGTLYPAWRAPHITPHHPASHNTTYAQRHTPTSNTTAAVVQIVQRLCVFLRWIPQCTCMSIWGFQSES